MSYRQDIEVAALEFVIEHEEHIKEGIVGYFEPSKIFDGTFKYLSDRLKEEEFDFTLRDAAVVIEESGSGEEEIGLWQGLPPHEAIIMQAMFIARNDFRAKIEELYRELQADYETAETKDFGTVFERWREAKSIKPVIRGSKQEKHTLEQWLRANSEVGFRGQSPLGDSYIDSRCGSGYDGVQSNYIHLDHETAERVPHLAGKSRTEVEEYMKRVFDNEGKGN